MKYFRLSQKIKKSVCMSVYIKGQISVEGTLISIF